MLVNDEPLHLRAFRQVLAGAGVDLSEGDYFTRYLGLADRDVARDALRRGGGGTAGADLDDAVDHLLALKALAYRELVRVHLPEAPGAAEFVLRAAERWPVAVASGSLRVEVEDGLYRLGIRDAVTALVTIEDVARGKPDPETFLAAREALVRIGSTPGAPRPLARDEPASSFLVVEDSPAGLAAARAASMPAVAVATSRPPEELRPALLVVADLAALDLDALGAL